jgi:hypothetical protein
MVRYWYWYIGILVYWYWYIGILVYRIICYNVSQQLH